MRHPFLITTIVLLIATGAAALDPESLRSVDAVPAHLAGRFRQPAAFQQSTSGQYFVFDRRAQTVYGLDDKLSSVWEIVHIGNEPGRIIDPVALAVEPEGTFVVADAPNGRERVQIFTPAGFRIGGFVLPGRVRARIVLDNFVVNGIGSLQYTGKSILLSLPDTRSLFTEYSLTGEALRNVGALRPTGHEADPELHFALNIGLPVIDPRGGFFFVFQTGEPMFRKYDAEGRLVFERRIQGREIDDFVARLPTTWPRRRTADGELPLVAPTVRTAAVDSTGNLWVSFVEPYTYVFDRDGDKTRTVQFRAAGIVSPNSLFFGRQGRLLVTPGLYVFDVRAGEAGKAGEAGR